MNKAELNRILTRGNDYGIYNAVGYILILLPWLFFNVVMLFMKELSFYAIVFIVFNVIVLSTGLVIGIMKDFDYVSSRLGMISLNVMVSFNITATVYLVMNFGSDSLPLQDFLVLSLINIVCFGIMYARHASSIKQKIASEYDISSGVLPFIAIAFVVVLLAGVLILQNISFARFYFGYIIVGLFQMALFNYSSRDLLYIILKRKHNI